MSNAIAAKITSNEPWNLISLNNKDAYRLQQEDVYIYAINKGVQDLNKGDYNSSIKNFLIAFNLKPDAAFPACQLGHCYLELKKYDSAIFYLNLAVKIKPDYGVAKHYKNIAEHRKNGEEDFD